MREGGERVEGPRFCRVKADGQKPAAHCFLSVAAAAVCKERRCSCLENKVCACWGITLMPRQSLFRVSTGVDEELLSLIRHHRSRFND